MKNPTQKKYIKYIKDIKIYKTNEVYLKNYFSI